MANNKLTHLDQSFNPSMVDVGPKAVTDRIAIAQSEVTLPHELVEQFENGELYNAKGPVFHTAVIAGIQATKQTSTLIPLCHALAISTSSVDIEVVSSTTIRVKCTVKTSGRTGVEMEALTGASVAALTIYDMCKGFSHDITIGEIKLIKKSGGKSDYEAQ